jgi:pyrimidine operon attenuation protein/uracil phosphoribosyltransferase
MTAPQPHVLLDTAGVEQALGRLADEIVDAGGTDDLILVGIRRRGVELAERLAELVADRTGRPVDRGTLDITLYRDDFAQIGSRPLIGTTDIPGDITGRRVVIVDDVLYTGRTIRAALNEIADFGRPGRIELCVLVDRGGRELPIQADYAGVTEHVPAGSHVEVHVPSRDGELSARIVAGAERAAGE